MQANSHQIALDMESEDRMELVDDDLGDTIVVDTSRNVGSFSLDPSESFSDRIPKRVVENKDTSTVAGAPIKREDEDDNRTAVLPLQRARKKDSDVVAPLSIDQHPKDFKRSNRRSKFAVDKNLQTVKQKNNDSADADKDKQRDKVTTANIKAQAGPIETYKSALSTLQYDTNPPERPHWLTGLNKPLPHPSLTSLEDYEVLTRFWFDEIKRLEYLRSKRTPPKGQPADGEWHYGHYGETKEVRRAMPSRKGKVTAVYVRGCWEYVVNGQKVWKELDEWPMTLEGETLGWGTRVLEDDDEEVNFRAEQLPEWEEK